MKNVVIGMDFVAYCYLMERFEDFYKDFDWVYEEVYSDYNVFVNDEPDVISSELVDFIESATRIIVEDEENSKVVLVWNNIDWNRNVIAVCLEKFIDLVVREDDFIICKVDEGDEDETLGRMEGVIPFVW